MPDTTTGEVAMRVAHAGPWRTLPRTDQIRIAVTMPFAVLAALTLRVAQALIGAGQGLLERLTR